MRVHLKIFKALSDRNRLRVVKMLEIKSMCVCEITSVLNLAPSTVSKHLNLLQEAGLIQSSKKGKWVDFHLPVQSSLPLVSQMLRNLRRELNEDPQVVEDSQNAQKVDRTLICRSFKSQSNRKRG